ncbi:Structure-specific endonuclease subunit SLX1 [Nakaseomyces bracarensis]|uniref:Structure-specific endonuclease subunit SLX1 n=1 Tax=Nakaseomyces bracarensis TaxID=273131 RepID=A0ABR4NMP3_9SACH
MSGENFECFPDFYCCYLLQSINKRQSFYIGSTPNPVRRLRQHNGSLTRGGAYRTKRDGTRPWEMILIVYGFPSRIAALQFEHAWQHGYQTRFIPNEQRVVKNKKSGRSIHHKLAMIRSLLNNEYFQYMSLTLHFFNGKAKELWEADKFCISQSQQSLFSQDKYEISISDDAPKDPKNETVDDTLEYSEENLKMVENLFKSNIKYKKDLFDVYTKKLTQGEYCCFLCNARFDYTTADDASDPLIHFCSNSDCEYTAHLNCTYKAFLKKEQQFYDRKLLLPTKD